MSISIILLSGTLSQEYYDYIVMYDLLYCRVMFYLCLPLWHCLCLCICPQSSYS